MKPIKISIVASYDKHRREGMSLRLKSELSIERAEYTQPAKMLVVSDIEGNFKAFRRLLINSGVINRQYQWTFGDGHLVVLGDCFDRGSEVLECLWMIYSLEERAFNKGGHVHFILGNHEIMNLNGDWRYVHPRYVKQEGENISHTALYDGSNELWRWLYTKNIMERIGEILFVHAGISRELNQLPYSIREINLLARPYYTSAQQIDAKPHLGILFDSENSPFWYRGYYNGSATEDIVDETLAKFNVGTIVTGHTVVEKVGCYFNKKVINVNTDHAAEISEALLIKGNQYYRVDGWGNREKIK